MTPHTPAHRPSCRSENAKLAPADPTTLAIYCFSAIHGLISLHSSGVLKGIRDDEEGLMKTYIEDIMRFVTG